MGDAGERVAVVVAIDAPRELAGRVARRFTALAGDHGGLVRADHSPGLIATFGTVPGGLETAAQLVLAEENVGLRCGVVTLEGLRTGSELLAAVASAEELCRSAEPGRIVIAPMARVLAGQPRAGHSDPLGAGETFGRTAELRALQSALAQAESGSARVLTLAGELGSGRSTMLAQLREAARSRGFGVLAVGGVEGELAARWTSFEAATLDGPGVGSTRFVERLPSLAAEVTDDRALARELIDFVAEATDARPLLITVDDLDRVDDASRSALVAVAGRVAAERCLVVAAAPESAEHRLGAEVIRLRDLAEDDLARIVERDGPIDTTVLRRCVKLAGGNPLAAREVSRSLSPRQRAGLDALPAVPEPAAAVLAGFQELLGQVSDAARRATVVTAADETGDSGVIRSALAELGEDPAGLEEAEEAGLLRIDGPMVRFTHPLLRPVAYHQVAARSRRAAHQALAVALHRPRQAAARAFQLAAAAVGPSESASEALELVAESEARRGDPLAAARAISRAAELTADDVLREKRLTKAATLYLQCGDHASVDSMLAELGDPAASPDALVVTSLNELARLGPARARARLDRMAVASGLFDLRDGLVAYLSALAGQPQRMSGGGGQLGKASRALTGADAGSDIRGSARFSPGVLGSLEASVGALALIEAGWLSEAGSVLSRLDVSSITIDPVSAQTAAGLLLLEAGRPIAALERLGDDDPQRNGATPSDCARLLALTRARLYCGRLDDADESLRQATTIIDRLGLGLHESYVDLLGGLGLHAQGSQDGLDLLQRARRKRPDRALGALVLATLDRGGSPGREWSSELRSLTAVPDPRVALDARRALAAMRDDIEALSGIAKEFEGAGLMLESVLTRGAAVSAALRVGHPATERLKREVAERTRRHGITCPGMRYWESEVPHDKLRQQLTPAEHRVAVAVGTGATNKEVSAQLFVSVKTVDYHLQNIYRKLGIRSRTELAVLMAGTTGTKEAADE